MKRIIFPWLLYLYFIPALAQSRYTDSLKLVLRQEKHDTTRVKMLMDIGVRYIFEKPETGLVYVQEGLDLARKINYRVGEASCLNALGHLNRMIGNYTSGIKYHLQALQIFEKLRNQEGIAYSFFGIAASYEDQGDYQESLGYYYKTKSAAQSLPDFPFSGGVESNMGLCFLKLGQLDSAIKYEQNAYEIQMNTPLKSLVLARLGSIHAAMNHSDVALGFYRLGVQPAIENSDNNALNELYFGMSTLFRQRQEYDSSIFYAQMALATANALGNPNATAEACFVLFSNYKKGYKTDSAFKYLELYATNKDTLITQDKIKQQQLLALQEKNREREKAMELKAATEKRKQDIQYAATAIGIICFMVLFILLSRSIVANAKWIRFLGVLALLMVFEFINLLIHPYLAHNTNHSPFLMLAALVLIGAMLIPLHHRIEKLVVSKMIEKNNRIRLQAAKKTVAALEGKVGGAEA